MRKQARNRAAAAWFSLMLFHAQQRVGSAPLFSSVGSVASSV